MAILISDDKKELVVTCDCGCDESVHIQIGHDDGQFYVYQSFMNGNFYRDQDGVFATLINKLKKIWAIIRNKDYDYSDVLMSSEDFQKYKEYINQF